MILFHIMAIVCFLLKGAVFSLDWHAVLSLLVLLFMLFEHSYKQERIAPIKARQTVTKNRTPSTCLQRLMLVAMADKNFLANGESESGPPGQRPLSPVVSPSLPVLDTDSKREDTSRKTIDDAIPVRSTSPESEARDQGAVATLGPPNALLFNTLWP